jgi:TRAP-type C4-dicarboxylate transport system permease small subunit
MEPIREKSIKTHGSPGAFFQRITVLSGYLSGFVIFSLMCLVTIAVVCRRVFQQPLIFSEEYSAYMMVFCVYLGAAYTLREDAHIRVDVVTIRLSERIRMYLRAITSCLSTIYGLVLTWKTLSLVIYYRQIGQRAMSVLETPTWIPAILVPVGLAILTMQMILCAVEDMRPLLRGDASSQPRGEAARKISVKHSAH